MKHFSSLQLIRFQNRSPSNFPNRLQRVALALYPWTREALVRCRSCTSTGPLISLNRFRNKTDSLEWVCATNIQLLKMCTGPGPGYNIYMPRIFFNFRSPTDWLYGRSSIFETIIRDRDFSRHYGDTSWWRWILSSRDSFALEGEVYVHFVLFDALLYFNPLVTKLRKT